MFNRKSIYALNKKDPNAIVYTDADGNLIRLTCDDFASEEEFLRWKVWSDSDLHITEKKNHIEANHTVAIEELTKDNLSIPSIDLILEQRQIRHELLAATQEQVTQIETLLTAKQFLRLWMYCVEGKTEEEIAVDSGITQQAVSKSLALSMKKTKKFLKSLRNRL